MKKDTLLVPEVNYVETPWPFTKLGRALDKKMEGNGIPLVRKDYRTPHEESNSGIDFTLGRIYREPNSGLVVRYQRNVPELDDLPPGEVMFVDNELVIPVSLKLKRAQDEKVGSEVIDLLVASDRDLQVGAFGIPAFASFYRVESKFDVESGVWTRQSADYAARRSSSIKHGIGDFETGNPEVSRDQLESLGIPRGYMSQWRMLRTIARNLTS